MTKKKKKLLGKALDKILIKSIAYLSHMAVSAELRDMQIYKEADDYILEICGIFSHYRKRIKFPTN